ncbi:MAG TPA: MBL fold metallo-hydrolase, partial [Fibrobacteria bacterium]|nr:MBL fold metallo-hydrolase [Fibrobacteria bacterium]
SVSATLATAPILAWNTGTVPWVGIPAGILCGVVFSVGFLAAIATVSLSFLPMWATSGFAGAADGAARLIWEITLRSGQWGSGVFHPGRPDVVTLVLALVSVACMAWMGRRALRWKLFSALLCAWGLWGLAEGVRDRRSLEVAFLDVGQGSAAVVRWPSGRVWLVDAGPASWKDPRRNAGKERILPFLTRRGIRSLDAVVVSHADLDHWGGLRGLEEALPPSRLLLSADSGTPGSPGFDSLVGDLLARGWSVERIGQGQKLTYNDGARCEVLGPGLSSPLPRNRSSLVLRFVFDSTAVVLAGDADSVEEAEILRSDLALGAEVLLAGHHGSRHSTHSGWLAAVGPRWTVLAYGPENRYGHPNEEVLRRLDSAGSQAVHLPSGSAVFHLDGRVVRPSEGAPAAFWGGPWRRDVSLARPWTWKPPFAKSSTRPPSSGVPSTGS